MRVALFSDIHGNAVALDAVLAGLEQEPVDQLVCLGDVAATGPRPREALARLQALACPVVMGNTDAWLLNPEPWPAEDEDARAVLAVELWGAGQLTETDRAFIRTFRPTVEVPIGAGQTLLCYHGSPRNYTDVIRAATPADVLDEYLAGIDARILVGGHTHEPMVRVFGEKLLVNPGSVGLPRIQVGNEAWNPLWAEYAVLEARNGQLSVDLRRAPVDFERLRNSVVESDMPYGDLWLRDWRRPSPAAGL